MKNYLLFGALALSVLGSCSNNDVVDINKGSGISFRASLDKAVASRATGTIDNVTTLQNLQAFNVTAIGNSANYFTNLAVTSADLGVNWTTASTYYWPGYRLNFYAYAPQSITGATVNITNTEQKITSFAPEQNVADQKDLLIATNIGDKLTNEGIGVSLNFKHILSQIAVQAKCSNDKVKIEVLGVKLVNMATKADFTFPTDVSKLDMVIEQDKWTNLKDANDHSKAYMIKGDSPVTLTNQSQSIMFGSKNFMLIPQKLTAWDNNQPQTANAYLAVLCRISSLNGSTSTLLYPQPTNTDKKDGKYAFAAVGIDTNWEPGKRYTYTLNFCGPNGGAGFIDPNPSNPKDGNDPKVDSNPVPDGEAGDPILGPITFNVTVDPWTEVPVDINL
ncbi:fimbrillin family protein [Bacteroides helcogenes]|uniref:Fimbrillin family protein n=1 Tax=Bacteroides helcogenes (strain ATCC 35417 / DSM 20613 / JCM 6297 / CCUG 15421 / P 36-108) TaxID=693979 RepID=E6SNH9_BACT6|nr:fimbrillin family protein [Bacteroides helcogenes]ADV43728.1 hypothetical protein Bache_1731 [Bacteroides helcogenes P 36-108]